MSPPVAREPLAVALLDGVGNLAVDAPTGTLSVSASVEPAIGGGDRRAITGAARTYSSSSFNAANGVAVLSSVRLIGWWNSTYTIVLTVAAVQPASSAGAGLLQLGASSTIRVDACAGEHMEGISSGLCVCSPGFRLLLASAQSTGAGSGAAVPDSSAATPEGSCLPCPLSMYRSAEMTASGGAQTCAACPPNMGTLTLGAKSSRDCVCTAGYYLERGAASSWLPAASGADCHKCPIVGTECPMGTVGMASIIVQRGYWRAGGSTNHVYKCAVDATSAEANCLGGDAASFRCAPVLTSARFVSALTGNVSSSRSGVLVLNPGASTALEGDDAIGNYTVSY